MKKIIIILSGILIVLSCKNEKPENLLNRVGGDANLVERSSHEFKDSVSIVNYEKGLIELRNEKLKIAKRFFLKSLNREPNNSTILNAIGSIEANLKDFKKSYNYFEKSLKANPSNTLTYMSYGVALNKSTEQLKAIKIWKKGLELESSQEKKGYFNYNIANAYYKLNEFKKSKKYNEIALEFVNNKEVRKDLMELKNALDKLIK